MDENTVSAAEQAVEQVAAATGGEALTEAAVAASEETDPRRPGILEDTVQSGVCGLLAAFASGVAIDAVAICLFARVAIRICAHGRTCGA